MKSFSHIFRRTHLYLSLFCLPWVVMYGITSIAFSHPDWFNSDGEDWVEIGSWPCSVEIPEERPFPRDFATELVRIAGHDAKAYGAYQAGANRINVYIPHFWKNEQLTYHTDDQKLVLSSRGKPFQHILTGMHARAGYQHEGFFNDLWAVMVDVVMISFLLWVITGLYIWWTSQVMRTWGWIMLIAGILSFAAMLIFI